MYSNTTSLRAFSLVELLTVIMVIAVASALAIPMISNGPANELRAAADLLEADLSFARMNSITDASNPHIVVFDSTNHRYHIALAATPTVPIANPVDNTPYTLTFGQGRSKAIPNVTIQAYSLDGDDRIQFGQYGQIDQTSDATITLSAKSKSITLTIKASTGETTIGDIN